MTTPLLPAEEPGQSGEQTAGAPSRRQYRLAREIVVILALKAAVLLVIWWAWFSAPETRRMQVPTERVQQRLINGPAVEPPRPSQSITSGNQDHAAH